MPRTHEWRTWFVHSMEYPTKSHPLVEPGNSRETDWPFRVGSSLVMRMPFSRRAFVIGKWSDQTLDEEVALLEALKGRNLERHEWDG